MNTKLQRSKWNKSFLAVAMMIGFSVLGGSLLANHQTAMKGRIIAADQNMVYVCVGSEDGIHPNQVLNVYQVTSEPNPNVSPRLRVFSKIISEVKIGTIQVIEVIDDHFSTAKIISGNVGVHDLIKTSEIHSH